MLSVIFGDLRLQALLLRGLVGDDLLDGAMNVLAGIEEGADLGHDAS
jgi:hypothetical protein